MEKRGLQADPNHRSQPRSNVFLAAALVVGTALLPVRLRNLSRRGALLEGPSLPSAGSKVRLVRGDLSAEGQIAWQLHHQAGLHFSLEIDVEQWVKRIGHTGQQRVDRTVAMLRLGQRPLANATMEPRLSLAEISGELDAICERLADAPTMSVELAEQLLRLNVVARNLQQISAATEK
jgi:hypothetical protein